MWIGAKKDLGPRQQVELFLNHEERLQREITKSGPGPWALAMSPSGVRSLNLRDPQVGGGESCAGARDSTGHRNVIGNDR